MTKIDFRKMRKNKEINFKISKKFPESNLPLVSVFTITYKHPNYIRECIEGVLAQKTKFSFEYIIGEDFSNDKTREIVLEYAKKYPSKIRVITENYNVGGRKNLIRCIKASRGKYIAICEGDDYWTDPYKLQKQVDIMQRDDSIAICAHRVKCFYQDEFLPSFFSKEEKKLGSLMDLLKRNYLYTCSVVIRRIFIPISKFERISKNLKMGDFPLFALASEKGSIFFLDDIMASYRIHKEGVWSPLPVKKKIKFGLEAKKTIMEEISGLSKKEKKEIWFNTYLNWSKRAEEESKVASFYLLFKAFLVSPLKLRVVFRSFLFIIYNHFYSFIKKIVFYLKERGWGKRKVERFLVDFFLWPFDFLLVIGSYKKKRGNYPNIIFPKTFSEKIQRNKLFFRKEKYIIFGDKLAVRDYVAEKIGSQFLTKIYWTGKDLKDVDKKNIPKSFVIKSNHASGYVIIVKDKDDFDWEEAYKITNSWMKTDFSYYRGEWHYRWIVPRLIIEEYLQDEEGETPVDYKFFCFNGKVKIIQVDFNRFSNHSRLLFDYNFNLLKVKLRRPLYGGKIKKPPNFEKMRQFAEKLSSKEPFLRVDFYDINKVVFSEITLYPGSGLEIFYPYIWDYKLGKIMD